MDETGKDNFLYWYYHASPEEVQKAREIHQKTIDELLIKYELSPINFMGVIFTEQTMSIVSKAELIDERINKLCDFIAERALGILGRYRNT